MLTYLWPWEEGHFGLISKRFEAFASTLRSWASQSRISVRVHTIEQPTTEGHHQYVDDACEVQMDDESGVS